MMYAFPLQVLITVVDRGKGDKMARLYERSGVKTQLMCLGFGTASVSMAALRHIQKEATIIETGEAEKMDEKRTHDMVVCVADRGQAELVMEAAKQAGASGGTVVHARGFNAKEEENFLHLLIRPEKELVLIIVPLADRKTVMQQICDAIAQTTGEAGVIFSLPVDDVMGLHQ